MFIVNDISFLRLLWAHLRLRIGLTIDQVINILVRPSREWKLFVPRPPELRIERWMKFGHNLPGDYDMMTFYHPWSDADLGTRPPEMGRPFTTPFNRDRADPRGV